MKNPWMSLWLSAANKAAGSTRSLWSAELQRQQQAFAKEMVKAWSAAMPAPAKPAPKRRRK